MDNEALTLHIHLLSGVIGAGVIVTEADVETVDQIHYQSDTFVVGLRYETDAGESLPGAEPKKVVVKM